MKEFINTFLSTGNISEIGLTNYITGICKLHNREIKTENTVDIIKHLFLNNYYSLYESILTNLPLIDPNHTKVFDSTHHLIKVLWGKEEN